MSTRDSQGRGGCVDARRTGEARVGAGVRRGLAITDLVVLLALIALAAAVLVPLSGAGRRMAQDESELEKLAWFVQVQGWYAADNQDKFATFSWKAGQCPSQFPDLQFAATDLEAAANQAVDIIRRRSVMTNFARVSGWLPHVLTSHVVFADYLDRPIPDKRFISELDALQIKWAKDPANWQQNNAPSARASFWSSYETGPAFYSSPDRGSDAMNQNTSHNLYLVPANCKFGGNQLSAVAHPSRKALRWDRYERHAAGPQPYFGYTQGKIAVLTADGSVLRRDMTTSDPGWNPNSPDSPLGMQYGYQPAYYEPPTLSGQSSDRIYGRLRWTRNALLGWDFPGNSVRGR
ncbi:MAG: hypothetical protein JNL50_11985 [Phycisphaerae bacterium]|nr:hypothetical protein [Phycisphaerae bacterium]